MKPRQGYATAPARQTPGRASMPWPLLLVAVVGLLAVAADPSSPTTIPAGANVCSMGSEQHWYLDRAPRVRLVVEALADSVLVGEYFTLSRGEFTTEPPSPDARGTLVFGQLARVVAAEGWDHDLASAPREVVLIWWDVHPDCTPRLPRRTLGAAPGEQLFIGLNPRPSSRWIAGIPTFDISPFADVPWLYRPSPRFMSPGLMPASPSADLPPRLTAQEFARAIMELPTAASVSRDRHAARRSLLAWAERNPEIVQRYPIADFVAAARKEEAAARR